MAKRKTKREEVEILKAQIEAKEQTVKAAQGSFAEQLKNGLGDEIIKQLSEQQEAPKQTQWEKIKENLSKIFG